MSKKILGTLTVLLLIILGFYLRIHFWPGYISFGYEQARDAILSTNIFLQKKLTLIGPTSEIEGLFHGPIYYYLIGLVYFIFGKNPANVGLFHILINLSCIPVIYFVGKKLFNQRVGLISAAIFTISYEVISYSIWLSNPSPALPFIILTYYFLYKSFKENHKYLPLAFFLLAISISFDLIIVVNVFGALALGLIYNRKPIHFKKIILSFLAFIVPLINYPIFEIKHQFLMTNKFFSVLNSQDAEFKSIFKYLFAFFDGFAKEFANVFIPIHGFFAGVFMIILLYFLWRKLRQGKLSSTPYGLILVWLFVNFSTFLIAASVTNSEFSYFGVNAASTLLCAAFLNDLIEKRKILLVVTISAVIVFSSFRAWSNYLPNPQKRLFDSQRGVILKDTLLVVDYTYLQSSGKPFFVNTITVPLYISPLWDYLYSWYGQEKYKYLPSRETKTETQYLITEPGWGQTFEIFKGRETEKLDAITKIENQKLFGAIQVEKRSLLPKTTK